MGHPRHLFTPARPPLACAPLVGAALLCVASCALDNRRPDVDGGLDFDLGGIPFRIASGAARLEGQALALYLTDQPDGCLAITQIPVGPATIFTLRVAPELDGTRSASVVQRQIAPLPGQAMGGLATLTGGVPTGGLDAIDGTVTWRDNPDGTTTIVTLDVGFVGTPDRLRGAEWRIPACR
jgi:hypothetical protein